MPSPLAILVPTSLHRAEVSQVAGTVKGSTLGQSGCLLERRGGAEAALLTYRQMPRYRRQARRNAEPFHSGLEHRAEAGRGAGAPPIGLRYMTLKRCYRSRTRTIKPATTTNKGGTSARSFILIHLCLVKHFLIDVLAVNHRCTRMQPEQIS
ncbi:MAG: hypothetical protein ACRD39_07195 [Nitrososphaeraceae archaeon]